jgi:hypothetical protein
MDILRILAETIAAVTLMTAFSYLVSESFRKLFAEPVLLNYVIRLSGLRASPSLNSVLGWLIHYVLGLLFVLVYEWLWNSGLMSDGWPEALVLGIASGIVGIIGWMMIFSAPRDKPRVAFRAYYAQLLVAHIIFAAGATAVHRMF